MLLITFPYAGGSFYSFRDLENMVPKQIAWANLELPGRGKQIAEPLLTSPEAVVDYYFNQVIKLPLREQPYAFYGHSMGGLMQYLLAHRLKKEGYPMPAHLFVSGKSAPSYLSGEPDRYSLPDDTFKQKLFELGGMPNAILENDELLDFFIPILKADFKAIETWQYQPREKLNVPITVFHGEDDNFDSSACQLWQKETTEPLKLHIFSGNHFFILDQWQALANTIAEQLINKHTV
jgi:surfactin synthase thioesterase subunit